MGTDPIDALLDASAPTRHDISATDLHAMILAAKGQVSPPRRTTRRTAVLGGVLALLLVGGAGVATASTDWLWSDGLDNPDRSLKYTAPIWGECEIRYSGWDTHDIFTQGDVNRIIDDWFANTDIETAAEPLVAEYTLWWEQHYEDDPAAQEDPRLPDLIAWSAHNAALEQLLHDELVAHGYGSGAGDLQGSESHSQLHCEGEDWGGEGSDQ